MRRQHDMLLPALLQKREKLTDKTDAVRDASSSQNVMSIWTARHMFDQFSFTRYLVGTPHYACFNEYTM